MSSQGLSVLMLIQELEAVIVVQHLKPEIQGEIMTCALETINYRAMKPMLKLFK